MNASKSAPMLLAACLAACLGTAARGAQLDCMIQPHQVVMVGSAAPGVIRKINVDRGDTVKKGQVLASLNAGVEKASLELAKERAEQTGEVAAASSAQQLAQSELKRASELYEQQFISRTFLDKQRAEAEVASGRTDQAHERRKLSRREVEVAAAQLAQRSIRAPIDGVVVERFASPGEFVDQKPVLRIAAIDPLRVDVLVPAAAFGQLEIGQKGRVFPELIDPTAREATVSSVDRVIDAASNTFRVRLELPNPDGVLPAGLRCKAELPIRVPEPARPAASAAAAAVQRDAQANAPLPVVARR